MSDNNENTQIQLAGTTTNAIVLGYASLKESLLSAAKLSVDREIERSGGNLGDYSELNLRAMYTTEALRFTAGLDLATVLTRGDLLKQIEEEGLVAAHPMRYGSLTRLAKDVGISSVTELSNIRTLCEVIFPYITDVLGWDLADTWEKIGKSQIFELVPALSSMMTGENASHETVRATVEQMLDNSAAEILADPENDVTPETLDEGEVRRNAVESLLRGSVGRTVRQVRRTIRPSAIPDIPMATMRLDEQWIAILDIRTQEQYDLINRLLAEHAENVTLDNPELTPAQRRFLRGMFGDTE
jgi:hypothetical protein